MYLQEFQLKAPPFADIPDSVWYVPHSGAESAFAAVCVALQQSDPVVVLNGVHGVGKTQLLRRLAFELDRTNILNFIGFSSFDSDQVLVSIAQGFDISVEGDGTAAVVASIGHFLHDCVAQDQRAILVIDDAHLASDAVLENIALLSNHISGGVRPLSIVLSGCFNQNRPLPAGIQARMRFRAELAPLVRDECDMYIQTRWHIAGSNQALDIDPDAIDAAHAFSEGVPRALGWALDSALTVSAAQREGRISAKSMGRALAILRGETPPAGKMPADAGPYPTPPEMPSAQKDSVVTPIVGAPSRLVITNASGESAEIDLALGEYTIGRAPECDIQLESSHISRQHARLEVTRDTISLVDLGGVNKALVNGDVIDRQVVAVGDRIQLGEFVLQIENV